MVHLRYRELTCVLFALVAGLFCIFAAPPISSDGSLFDVLVKARSLLFPEVESKGSPVAVVALDERSLDSPELAPYPRVMLAPVWARILDALFSAGAQEIGFDLIFAYDPDQFPGIPPNFDQSFLRALAAHRGHMVLARSRDSPPALPFTAAAGFDALGLAEIKADADGRYRHVVAGLVTSTGFAPGFAFLLIKHAANAPPMPSQVLIAPRRHLESIPTYSVIDVLHCTKSPEALASAFKNKAVLIGSTIPEEDRKVSSGRFLKPAAYDSRQIAACGLRLLGASVPDSETVPGVFLHAAAVDAALSLHLTQTLPPIVVAAVAAALAGVAAGAGLLMAPWMAAGAVSLMVLALFASAVCALRADWWLPIALPLYATVAAAPVSYMVRYLVEERTRLRIQRAFGHYLSPKIVERLASDPAALHLGGEEREVTVMFADLSGFTELSTRVSAGVLTARVNQYLGYVVREVEATGGYIDKFIGDAVMAIWGAPAADPMHAVNAVRAALAAANRIADAKTQDEANGRPGFSIKIALNSGPAVVGNVGTENRYNYTAIGETVNLASRLERIPPLYHCTIVAGPRTAELVQDRFLMRELDWVLVKGESDAVAVHEPIAERDVASGSERRLAERFAQALELYRAAHFSEALLIWQELAAKEKPTGINPGKTLSSPSTAMAVRAGELLKRPPVGPWLAVNRLEK